MVGFGSTRAAVCVAAFTSGGGDVGLWPSLTLSPALVLSHLPLPVPVFGFLPPSCAPFLPRFLSALRLSLARAPLAHSPLRGWPLLTLMWLRRFLTLSPLPAPVPPRLATHAAG